MREGWEGAPLPPSEFNEGRRFQERGDEKKWIRKLRTKNSRLKALNQSQSKSRYEAYPYSQV